MKIPPASAAHQYSSHHELTIGIPLPVDRQSMESINSGCLHWGNDCCCFPTWQELKPLTSELTRAKHLGSNAAFTTALITRSAA